MSFKDYQLTGSKCTGIYFITTTEAEIFLLHMKPTLGEWQTVDSSDASTGWTLVYIETVLLNWTLPLETVTGDKCLVKASTKQPGAGFTYQDASHRKRSFRLQQKVPYCKDGGVAVF